MLLFKTFAYLHSMRYSRQTILKEFGHAGQAKLAEAKVLVVGAGGLGGPVLKYLAGAGVGCIGIIDDDVVDVTNLHRQVHFADKDVGRPKAQVAKEKLEALNPEIKIIAHATRLAASNAKEIISAYDVVVDGSDNFPTRYLVNDACVLFGKPLVYGAIHQYEGQVSVFNYQDGPNYRDLFPQPPAAGQVPNCAEAGVLGVLPGVIGTMQANEALKIITGIGKPLSGSLLIYDAQEADTTKIKIKKNSDNPLTGDQQTQSELIDYDAFCGINPEVEISVDELKKWQLVDRPFSIVDVRSKEEFENQNIGGLHIPVESISDRKSELPKGRIVFVCQSGKRSLSAIHTLQKENIEQQLFNLTGGLNKWFK